MVHPLEREICGVVPDPGLGRFEGHHDRNENVSAGLAAKRNEHLECRLIGSNRKAP